MTAAKPEALLVWHRLLAVNHPVLDLHSAADGVCDTAKFSQRAVAGVLDVTAAMLLDLRIDQLAEMRLHALMCLFLIRSHKARIPNSAARIAMRRRVWFMRPRRPPTEGPTDIARDARGYANAWRLALRRASRHAVA